MGLTNDERSSLVELRLDKANRFIKEADYNCEYDVSKSDVESMQQPAHNFINEIVRLIEQK